VLADIIKAVMPTLALTIVMAVAPMFITMLAAKVEKLPTKSAVDFELGRKYYIFQFFVLFLFNVILGAASSGKAQPGEEDLPIVTLFRQLKDDPNKITQWLGSAVPQQVRIHSMCAHGSSGVQRMMHAFCRRASSCCTCSRACWRQRPASCGCLER
jgi:Calcium-dependent channel, 7TM region, putative phosphate